MLSTLIERKLIKTVGRKQVIGRPFMYATTREFLERFGLNDLNDLPKVEEMSDALGFELPSGLIEPTDRADGAAVRGCRADGQDGTLSATSVGRNSSCADTAAELKFGPTGVTMIRLQKILSAAGVASRRTAETLITAGPRDGQRPDRHRAWNESRSRHRRNQG